LEFLERGKNSLFTLPPLTDPSVWYNPAMGKTHWISSLSMEKNGGHPHGTCKYEKIRSGYFKADKPPITHHCQKAPYIFLDK
jgi:hypothetical protein